MRVEGNPESALHRHILDLDCALRAFSISWPISSILLRCPPALLFLPLLHHPDVSLISNGGDDSCTHPASFLMRPLIEDFSCQSVRGLSWLIEKCVIHFVMNERFNFASLYTPYLWLIIFHWKYDISLQVGPFKYDVVISSSDMMPPKLFAGFEAPYSCQEGKPAVVAKVMALAGKPLTSSLLYSSIMLWLLVSYHLTVALVSDLGSVRRIAFLPV